MAGFKGRVARMLLNFLDEHGNYRESLEEAAARAAAAEANSLLARQEKKRGRKKGRRSRGNNLLSDDDEDDEWDEDEVQPKISQAPPNNGLPEDPYEQIQFYFQTFKSRTSSQLQQKLHSYQSSTVHWIHGELHHNEHVSTTSLLIFMISLVSFISKRRSKTYGMYKRIHAILGKKFQWRSYLHSNFIRGVVLYQLSSESIPKLEKLRSKAAKAEEVALQSMRPYQRRRYERLNLLEVWGERVVMTVLVCGMLLSGMTFCMSLYNLILASGMMIRIGGFTFGPFTTNGEDESMTDGHIHSLDGETDYDGYPLHLRDAAEQRYAECIVDAEMGGNDPKELCDLNAFFGDAAADAAANNVPKSILRTKINALLNQIGIPSALSSYLTALPNQTLAYLSSLFTLCLFVLSHYISHKIHIATMSNDPMKHFVVVDKTVKADGTVEAKKGETEAQRKKRERLLQAERYKAQMAQLAYEAKTKAQARIARLEGKEAAKREEEEKEKKAIEEQDETVKLYGRQFMMIKAGVPDGAILNSFVPMGIEGEEAKEILTKLHEIKERRSAEAKKAEEEEAKKAEAEKKEEEMKDRIAADRLKKLKSGKLPRTSTLPSSSTANAALKRKNSLPPKLPKPVEKTGEEITEEAKRETEKAPGVKVVQPWAPPSKKENRGAKNKRWDKVTKSWVDRDLETDGADAVPTSVVLKKDEGEEEDMDHDLAVPVVEKKPQSAPLPAKVEVDPTALRASLMSQLRDNSPSPDQSNQRSVPRRVSLDKKDSSKDAVPATTDKVEVVEQKYDAKKFNPISERTNTEKSEETKVTSQASSQSSSPPPVLLRVTESPDDDVFAPRALDVASPWSRRSSARDIKAMIEAVEAAPEDQAEELFLGPNNFHSPAFETAMRASNSSWDKRPSSSDILEKIRAAEQQGANAEADKALRRSTTKPPTSRMTRIDEGKNMTRHLRPNDDTDCKIGTSLLKKTRSQGGINSDDEISEISMVDELSVTSATFANTPKGTPKQLKKTIRVTEKELSKIPRLDAVDKSNVAKVKDEASETGTVVTGKSKNSASKSEPREETEEEKLRKKKAEERAKKFEAMNARRRKGKGDDDGTAVSGISRRQRIRRKRSALAAITPEEKKRDDWKKGIFASVLNVEQKRWKKSIYAHVINADETRAANIKAQQDLEELNAAARRRIENQKRLDAKARKFAARAEKFHKLRRSDDGSVVSSASRMRRRRTRKAGVDTPPRRTAAPSSEASSVNENSAPPCQQTTSIVEVTEKSLPKEQEATGVKVTGVSMELIKENETDTIAVTEQKDASTAESSDHNGETDDKVAIGLEEKVEVKHSVEEVNAVLNSANSEPLPVDEKAIPAAEQNKGKTDGQLDDNNIDLDASSNEVVDQPASEKGVEDTLISASNDEEKKTEPESEKPLPNTPTSPIKKFKNRRRAAAKKKKKKGST